MIALEFSESETTLLRTLLAQYDDLVQSGDDDPALERLFPIAYPDDADAAAEFSKYTRSGLVDTKTANAGVVAAGLVEDGLIELDSETAERWLPVLTDLRLVIANRLGIVADHDAVPDDALGEVYEWLGALQSHLIDAIEALE